MERCTPVHAPSKYFVAHRDMLYVVCCDRFVSVSEEQVLRALVNVACHVNGHIQQIFHFLMDEFVIHSPNKLLSFMAECVCMF
jgi:hypothetical protein